MTDDLEPGADGRPLRSRKTADARLSALALVASLWEGCFAASPPAATFVPQTERLLQPGSAAVGVAAAGGSELGMAHAGGAAARLAVGLAPDKEGQVEGFAAWLSEPVSLTSEHDIGHTVGPDLWAGRAGLKGKLARSTCYLAGVGAGGTTDGSFTSGQVDVGVVTALPWDIPSYVRGSGSLSIPIEQGPVGPLLVLQTLGRAGTILTQGTGSTVLFEVGAGALAGLYRVEDFCLGADCGQHDGTSTWPGVSAVVFASMGVEFGRRASPTPSP